METAIEILLRSENTSGSKARFVRSIRAFYGLEPNQLVSPQSNITVDAFAKDLVRDRSRILHGTWSTLSHPLHISRATLSIFARDLLIRYGLEIDTYAAINGASDDVEKFLAYVETKRDARWERKPETKAYSVAASGVRFGMCSSKTRYGRCRAHNCR